MFSCNCFKISSFDSRLDPSFKSHTNDSLINLKNISYSNFGYNKNTINGDVFDTKFKTEIDDKHSIKFKLLNTGFFVDLFFNENKNNNHLSGFVRSKVLNAKTKFDFCFLFFLFFLCFVFFYDVLF